MDRITMDPDNTPGTMGARLKYILFERQHAKTFKHSFSPMGNLK